MAHRTGTSGYRALAARLNKFPQGAPPSETLFRILSLLVDEREAALLARLPLRPFTADAAARIWGISAAAARFILDDLADRAMLVDSEVQGQRLYVLPPPMAGFFEFSMMRVRKDVDQAALASLLHQYINVEDEFITALFGAGETQIGRALVHEPALEALLSAERSAAGEAWISAAAKAGTVQADGHCGAERGSGDGLEAAAESAVVLDHERASEIIRSARHRAVSACFCRHKKHHLGSACAAPLEICMSFDFIGDSLIRHGHARAIDEAEALELLEQAQEAHLLQFAENVRRSPKFLCHCCSCCCDVLVAARRFGFLHPIHTTNYMPVHEPRLCRACGRCVEVCPIAALELRRRPPGDGRGPAHAVRIDPDRCLGCGLCTRVCPYGAVTLRGREQRVLTPLNTTQRLVVQAIEAGTLPYFVFHQQSELGHRALAAILGVIVKLPPFKQALASKQMKSRYLERICDRPQWDY